jgi:hypothetical protein
MLVGSFVHLPLSEMKEFLQEQQYYTTVCIEGTGIHHLQYLQQIGHRKASPPVTFGE